MTAAPLPLPDGRWPVNGQLLPLRFTTICWFNRWKNGGYSKVLAAYGIGVYKTFAYGTHTPPSALWLRHHRAERRILQTGIVCTAPSGVIMTDVDFLAEYRGTRTAKLIGREHAFTFRRDDRFHIAIDARAVPLSDWPRKRPIAGADIISNGFVPWPGSRHYSGEIYKPARVPWHIVPAWPGLIDAIHADQADHAGRPASRSGDHRLGHHDSTGGDSSGEPVPDLDELIRTGIPAGARNVMLYKLACSRYRRLGSDSPAVLDELRQVWAASGSDFSWQEVKTLAGSARRFIERKEAADAELYRQAMRWLSRSRI